MKAAYYEKTGRAKDVLKIGNFDSPKLGSNEVLILLKYSGINPSDVKKRMGWQNKKMDFPLIIPHSDGSGEIIDVGKNLSKEYIGKKVWIWTAQGGYNDIGRAFGTAAEFITVPLDKFYELPRNLSFAEGACLGVPAMTAYDAVFFNSEIENKTILVQGAGGVVGHFAVQFVKVSGGNVIASVGSKKREKHAKDAGAKYIFNRHDNNFINNILDATNGKGVDQIIEIDFGKNIDIITKVLKPNGLISSYSSTGNPNPIFPYYKFASKGCKISIIQSFNFSKKTRENCCKFIEKISDTNNIKVPIGKILPLDDIISAHELVENQETIGNVVLEIN